MAVCAMSHNLLAASPADLVVAHRAGDEPTVVQRLVAVKGERAILTPFANPDTTTVHSE
jgi:hypothetical protein